jgi:hypothetical protein
MPTKVTNHDPITCLRSYRRAGMSTPHTGRLGLRLTLSYLALAACMLLSLLCIKDMIRQSGQRTGLGLADLNEL